jgi:hypothetical protein
MLSSSSALLGLFPSSISVSNCRVPCCIAAAAAAAAGCDAECDLEAEVVTGVQRAVTLCGPVATQLRVQHLQ